MPGGIVSTTLLVITSKSSPRLPNSSSRLGEPDASMIRVFGRVCLDKLKYLDAVVAFVCYIKKGVRWVYAQIGRSEKLSGSGTTLAYVGYVLAARAEYLNAMIERV